MNYLVNPAGLVTHASAGTTWGPPRHSARVRKVGLLIQRAAKGIDTLGHRLNS